ncbi:type II toxin-antitoxin system YafQ family toxin [Duncaniella freteri]|nr:type II toxin-antitoxin system YafQ family toxin [Duncaniella freteri]
MNYRIEVSNQYLRDLKLARKRNLDESKLNDVIKTLASGAELPAKNRDHALTGNYKGYRECHISPDWLLIYSRNNILKILSLVRTGSH